MERGFVHQRVTPDPERAGRSGCFLSGMAECTYDVTVIGAGIAGLTTAALLAKAGMEVCVVEQASQPGGYLAGFERSGFHFDTSIHWLNQCGPGGMARKVFDFIGPGAPSTEPQTNIRRFKGDSFNYLLTSEPDVLRNQLISDFPAEARGIRAFFKAARSLGESLTKASVRFRTTKSMGPIEKCIFGLRSARFVWPFVRYGSYTAQRGLNRFFRDERLKRVYCSEESLLSCLVPIAWSYAGDYQHPPKTGSGLFARWMCETLAGWGVDVRLNCRVTSVLLDNGRAAGVRVATGRGTSDIRSGRVLAACDVDSLYRALLPEGAIGRGLLDRIGKAETYRSAVTVFLGLDCTPAELGLPGDEIVTLTRDDVSRADHNGTDPRKAAITVFCPSSRDPSMAPQGKGTLVVFVAASYDYADHWRTERAADGTRVRGSAYRQLKEEFARILVERVEEGLLPGLRRHIEVCEAATPLTYQRYTGNKDGSMMGFRPGMKNMRARVAQHQTPVEGLLLCGHWSSYGGGVPAAVRAATNASLLVLQNTAPRFCALLKDVADGKLSPAAARQRWDDSRAN